MMKKVGKLNRIKWIIFISIFMLVVLFTNTACRSVRSVANADQFIDIDNRSPWYWNYKGKTVLLLGGSWQDNMFNHPVKLEEHLDVLVSSGGNYLRNTMSHRNIGNVFAYVRNDDGLFDLERFNDEYWDRFKLFLDLTYERDIIVQIEIWDPWDKYEDHQSFGGWSHYPFNPANNINYTAEESGLPTVIEYPPRGNPTEHPYFRTVPALDNNRLILKYQEAFVDKLLSISLQYPNILYCMHNETGEFIEFGDYWADYVRNRADEQGKPIHITDMRRNEDVRSQDHAHIFDNHQRYTFVDISQNNAWSGLGQGHYDNILYVRERLKANPRPINNNKNYGAARHGEEESVARMGRIVFAGAASARFHRPHPSEDPADMFEKTDFGMGLSARSQKIIQSLRMATDQLDIALTLPRNDLLGDREENEAYLLAEPGRQYSVYFPDGGTVTIDMSHTSGQWQYRWINMDEAEWGHNGQMQAGSNVRLTTPGDGHWIAVILPLQSEENFETVQIQPFSGNPFYWQYKGEPKLLLGGSWQDNLFNHPEGLEEHLDVLVTAGGNYLRNTMSHRNMGNVFAYVQSDGKFDLDEFNPEYWQRFENFLRMTKDRDIIVQIEVFDPWDRFADHQSLGGWSKNPFNPDNNINYTSEESGLPTTIDYNPKSTPSDHPFYKTVPALDNNELILGYQLAEVDKMLSISLNYPNVLYCLHNETGEDLAFGDFFADHLHQKANEKGQKIFVTDMRYDRDISLADYQYIYDNPQRYNFIDISQNNWQSGQVHYDRIMYVRHHILENPRPVNFNKIYSGRGGEHDEAVARFFRIIFSGGASARFHRPHPLEDPGDHYSTSDYGLGLSPMAQAHIRGARMLTKAMNIFSTEPRNDLLSERQENEAYLLAEPGKQYAIYFPDGGQVILDMSDSHGKWHLKWLDISENMWMDELQTLEGGNKVHIKSPGKGHQAALILPAE